MPETPDQIVARRAREQIDERSLEAARVEACRVMGWASVLDAAIDSIRTEIFNANQRRDLSPRDKQMNEAQLNYCIKVLQKRRNERAEEAVELWKQASGKSSESYS